MFLCSICNTTKNKFRVGEKDIICKDCSDYAKRACKCFGVNIDVDKCQHAVQQVRPSEVTVKVSELEAWKKCKIKHLFEQSLLDIVLVCKECQNESKNKLELFTHCEERQHTRYSVHYRKGL